MDVWQKDVHPWLESEIAAIRDWGKIPEYANALELALGQGALDRLEREAGKQMTSFNAISRQLYSNFMAIVRDR